MLRRNPFIWIKKFQTIQNEFVEHQNKCETLAENNRPIDCNAPAMNESHFIIFRLHNESITATAQASHRPGGHSYSSTYYISLGLIVNKAKIINTVENRTVIIKEKSLIEFPRMPRNTSNASRKEQRY